jgi:hypothetical protein
MKRFLNIYITKTTLPKLCIDCKYFVGEESRWPYDDAPQAKYGKCKLFGKINLVSGEINYEYASLAREDDKMCGKNGKLFEKHLDI